MGIAVGERRDGPQAEVENYTDLMQVINSTPLSYTALENQSP